MSATTNLQVPMSKTLKNSALKAAKEQGFSSLQEFVRVMLTKLSHYEINVGIGEQFPPVQLSEKAIKRYDKMSEDFEKGENIKSFNNIEDLMKDLAS